MMNLRVNYILPQSRANGPGNRYTIWVQGCSIHCPGCSNKDTWDAQGGKDYNIDLLAEDIHIKAINSYLDGVTITGGEPLDQIDAVTTLIDKISNLSIFLTTGYTPKQIISKGYAKRLAKIDILCTGPFQADKICSGEWRGSSNQEIAFLTDLGKKQSKMPVVLKEVHVGPSGCSLETGFTM